jgi:hypothetical protein
MEKNYNLPHLDAAENAFFARQLELIKARLYNTKYAELKARSLLPVSYEAGPGTRQITYRTFSLAGIAKHIASYSDDLPRSDVFGVEQVARVHDYGIAFGYNRSEIQAAAKAGVALSAMKGEAARRGWEIVLDDIVFSGDSQLGSIGINNIPSANTYTVPAGASTGTTFGNGSGTGAGNKTPDEILQDLFKMEETPLNNTLEVESADTLCMPLSQFYLVRRKPRSGTSDTTILQFFLANARSIKQVIGWYRLAGAGSGATDRMLSYRRDEGAIWIEIPEEFTVLPPETKNLEIINNCVASTAGVICPYPLSVTYGDGI